MRNNNTTPNAAKRFHPLRLVIACTLIALLLVSTSIGLSYARYHNTASNNENINFFGNNFIHGKDVVVAFINRDSLEPTVLNYNDEIIVSVPRGLTAEDTSIAYGLFVKGYTPAAYDISSGDYKVSASLQLVGISNPFKNSAGEWDFTLENVTENGSDAIGLKVKAENTASALNGKIDDQPLTTALSGAYAAFSSVSGLGTNDSSSSASVSISYTKTSWSDVAENPDSHSTSWYDDDPTATSYTIENATQLAGLAKLVNEGKDFEGVTFTLANEISLYGTGGEGDIREWTPIGTVDHPFKGNFDGNGKSITGLTLSGGIDADNVGLFGVVEGDADSYIKDLTLVNPAVYAQEGKNTGTLIGQATGYRASGITMTDLKVSGGYDSDDHVGSVAGEATDDVFTYECTIMFTADSRQPRFVGNRISSDDPTEPATEAPTEAPTDAPPTEPPTEKPTVNYELPAY